MTVHHHPGALEAVGVSLTGAVAYGHGFTLSSVSIKRRQRDLVLVILLDPLEDGPFALAAHPQLKPTQTGVFKLPNDATHDAL